MPLPVIRYPVAQRLRVDIQLARYLIDRQRIIDYPPGCLLPEFLGVLLRSAAPGI